MPRDWSDESWVKLYRRDEPEWACLPIIARGMFYELMRKVDRCGMSRVGKDPAKSLAVICHMTLEEARGALPLLLEDGCIRILDGVLTIPNFLEAQEAKQSDRARQAKAREIRRASQDVTPASHGVTDESRDATEPSRSVTRASRDVTRSHEEKRREETRQEETRPEGDARGGFGLTPDPEQKPRKVNGSKPRTVKVVLPDSWHPNQGHIAQAAREGGKAAPWVENEAKRMRDWATAKGERCVDWDARFRNWLRKAMEGNGSGRVPQPSTGRTWPGVDPIKELARLEALDALEAKKGDRPS